MNRRRKHNLPFAALAALLFNASMCAAPFIAARALSTAYAEGEARPQYDTSSEAIAATRQAIDSRFEQLSASGAEPPREVWSNFVREELETGDMTTVNGLLQAAPAMLGGDDAESLKARLAVSDSDEQSLIQAALTYLPEDVQETYEKRNAPIISMFSNSAPPRRRPRRNRGAGGGRGDADQRARKRAGGVSSSWRSARSRHAGVPLGPRRPH